MTKIQCGQLLLPNVLQDLAARQTCCCRQKKTPETPIQPGNSVVFTYQGLHNNAITRFQPLRNKICQLKGLNEAVPGAMVMKKN